MTEGVYLLVGGVALAGLAVLAWLIERS